MGEPNVREATAADGVEAAYINSTIDAGVTPLRYAIGDQVWYDLDRDGTRQAGEPAAAATVSLLSGETVVATHDHRRPGPLSVQLTWRPGSYQVSFGNLPPAPCLHRPRRRDRSRSQTPTSTPRPGSAPVITLGPGSPNLVPAADAGINDADFVNLTVSAGLVGSYALGDTVWRDDNGNGVLDAGDGGCPA